MSGRVFLVGAGPGDPKLITIKGLECIQMADVLVYDRLANPELLKHAKQDTELIGGSSEIAGENQMVGIKV